MTSTYNYQRNSEGTYYAMSTLEHVSPPYIVPEIVSLIPKYTGLYLYGPNQRYVPDNSLDAYPGDRPTEREITGLNLNTVFGNNINKFLSCGIRFYSTNDPVHMGPPQEALSLIYGRNGNSLRFTAISKNIVVTALHFTSSPQNYAGQVLVYFYHNNQIISRTIQKVVSFKTGNGVSIDGLVVYERVNGNIVATNVTSDFLNYFSELSPTSYTDLRQKLGSGNSLAFYDLALFILDQPLPDDFITPYILENDALRDLMEASESAKYLHSIGIDQENHLRYCSQVFDDFIFLMNYNYRFFIDTNLIKNMYLNYTNLFLDELNPEIRLNKILAATAFSAAVVHDSSSPVFWYDDILSKPIIHKVIFIPPEMIPHVYESNNSGNNLGSGSNPTINVVEKFYNYLVQFGAVLPNILKITDNEYLNYKNSVISFKNKHKNYQQSVNRSIDNTISTNSLFKLLFTTKNKQLTPFISFIPANTNIKKTIEVNNIDYSSILTTFYNVNYSELEVFPQINASEQDNIILKYSKYIQNNSVNTFKLIKSKYLVLIVDTLFDKLPAIFPDGRVLCNDENEIAYATTDVNSLFYNSEINAENYLDYSVELELFDEYDNQLHELNSNYIFSFAKIQGTTTTSIPSITQTAGAFQTALTPSLWFYNFYLNKNALQAAISYPDTNSTNKIIYSGFNDITIDDGIKVIDFSRIVGTLHIVCKILKNNIIEKQYNFKFYKNNNSNVINVTGYNITNNNTINFYNEVDEESTIFLCPDSGTVDGTVRFTDLNYASKYEIVDGIALFPNIKQENINILDYPFGITTSEIVQPTPNTDTGSTNGSITPTSSKIRVQAVKNSSGTYDIIEIIESGE